jgi:cytochrome P450
MYFAGTQTVSLTQSSLISLINFKDNAHIKKKLLDEIDPLLKGTQDYVEEFNLDEIEKLTYLRNCFMEALRVDSPVRISTALYFKEPCVVQGVEIPAYQ